MMNFHHDAAHCGSVYVGEPQKPGGHTTMDLMEGLDVDNLGSTPACCVARTGLHGTN